MRYRADVDGRTLWLELDPHGRLVVDGGALDADCVAVGGGVYSVIVAGRSHEVVVLDREGDAVRVRVDGRDLELALASEREQQARAHARPAHASAMELRAPMPGLIVAVHAREGEVVEEGGSVCTLEAMKMENELTVPRRARVSRLPATAGMKVNGGDLLAVLVPE